MKKIKIKNRKEVALVDDEDFNLLNKNSWNLNTNGYAQLSVRVLKKNGKYRITTIKMHRLITNCPRNLQVDHINHNRLDNRKENLRICTKIENSRNKSTTNGRRYKGVSWSKRERIWKAYIRDIYLGRFRTKKEGAVAYNAKAIQLFGKYAFLNKV